MKSQKTNRLQRLAIKLSLVAIIAIGLSGCSGLIPGLGPVPNVYDLSPKNTFRDDLPVVSWQLVVEEPTASSGLDNERIALKPNAFEYKYFAEARWSERAPKLIQTLMVESFENSGKIVAVGRQSIGLRSDYNLKGELREFQAEYEGSGAPKIHIKVVAKMVRQPKLEIVAARSFEYSVQARDTQIQSVIVAFDEALDKLLRQIVEWALTAVPPEVPRLKSGGGAQ